MNNHELYLEYKIKKLKVSLTEAEYTIFSRLKINGTLKKYLDEKANKFTVKKAFFNGKKVEDKHRYTLKYLNDSWELTKPCGILVKDLLSENIGECDRGITKNIENNNILIILESPHIDEYDLKYCKFKPCSPANGDTGQRFSKCFTSQVMPILKSFGLILCTQKTYSICFVNPVPYQASLYKMHKKPLEKTAGLRDKV